MSLILGRLGLRIKLHKVLDGISIHPSDNINLLLDDWIRSIGRRRTRKDNELSHIVFTEVAKYLKLELEGSFLSCMING